MHAPLTVALWTEKREFKPGEKIRIFFRANKPCYVRLMHVDAEGRAIQLLPNPYRTQERFQADEIVIVPEPEDMFQLEASSPYGVEQLILFASTLPLRDLDVTPSGLSISGPIQHPFSIDGDPGDIDKAKLKEIISAADFFETRTEIKTIEAGDSD